MHAHWPLPGKCASVFLSFALSHSLPPPRPLPPIMSSNCRFLACSLYGVLDLGGA
ncbi:hypothetical protein OIDMADRAFT_16339 [Oidiodendron maius Zn]|uniref:Uncharacterized protein n=1 Tax=Oidiodendron maius (strain Zn) TaxID=913774 RepID=A0A0C3D905_OIDMZ|nr:hypothetical protein OIDMADRAFT_16339 [Oidiodendron maius Zn]